MIMVHEYSMIMVHKSNDIYFSLIDQKHYTQNNKVWGDIKNEFLLFYVSNHLIL